MRRAALGSPVFGSTAIAIAASGTTSSAPSMMFVRPLLTYLGSSL